MSETQKQAMTIAKECFAVRLRKLNRVVSAIYEDSFRPFGLTIAQFNLLIAIGARGQASPTQLVHSLSLEKSTVSRNIEKMKKKGWVSLVSATDKRSHLLTLTPSGDAILEIATPAWTFAQEKAAKTLGPLSSIIGDISLS
ncbi:MAG: winged helix-turn-helix transcriptional regulator [Sneathiella sp.]|nr:winged helix-turn-helix transcriptional regulator [Sneathiella sp.]